MKKQQLTMQYEFQRSKMFSKIMQLFVRIKSSVQMAACVKGLSQLDWYWRAFTVRQINNPST
jgi:hypothetical protein